MQLEASRWEPGTRVRLPLWTWFIGDYPTTPSPPIQILLARLRLGIRILVLIISTVELFIHSGVHVCPSLPPEVVASKYSAVNTTDDYLMLHTVWAHHQRDSIWNKHRWVGSSLGQQDPSDPLWILRGCSSGPRVVCARPQRCTVSDEHREPQHSLAIVRIYHPGQRLDSGGAGLHVQTCKPVYEQPPAALSASVSDAGPNECNAAQHLSRADSLLLQTTNICCDQHFIRTENIYSLVPSLGSTAH